MKNEESKEYLIIGIVFIILIAVFLLFFAPKFLGIVAGIITSVALAFCLTMFLLSRSNDAGADMGSYQDFTDEPMKLKK